MTRAIIADDALLLRQGVIAVLATLDVVAEADDYDALMVAVDEHQPDLVITDIRIHRP